FLWTARTVKANVSGYATSGIRWYQIDLSGWPDSLTFAQTALYSTNGAWQFYPAIAVDSANNMILVFGRSSATEFPSIYYTWRLATDPPNTLRDSVPLKSGGATLVTTGMTSEIG